MKYRIDVHDDPSTVDALAWDRLLGLQSAPTPFMKHAFISAMHEGQSASAANGWKLQWITLSAGEELVAGALTYLKSHSYGEYVFDWSWAQAFERTGRRYYPKLLGASPFSPVPGTRLVARDPDSRVALAQVLTQTTGEGGASSAHILFIDEVDRAVLERAGWMIRHGVQFHWQAPALAPPATFGAFLQTLHRDKRKKIQQEQRRVREAGVTFRLLEGDGIDPSAWDLFYACHENTYAQRGSMPYLTRDTFARLSRTMPSHWLMVVATRDGRDFATSLIAKDDQLKVAYGRYWGCIDAVPFVHFDACYYQPLAWCIERGYLRFEGGAQGEHKLARGFTPSPTMSAHWIADPGFAQAVSHFLKRESMGVTDYMDELAGHSPFKAN
jgi:uncharacterized protein